MSALDRLLPRPDIVERHHRDVAGPPERADAAIRAFTLAEMPLARALFAARGLTARRGGLVGAVHRPLVEQMVAGGFTLLGQEPGRELVIGAIAQPWRLRAGLSVPLNSQADFTAFDRPGFVKMAMGFQVEARGSGTRVRTETRVLATDPGSRRAFALYWVPVRVGSGLIRRAMLRAIARRVAAEATGR